jgi:DNA-formamidopyrimidine glycosylase
MPESPEVAYQRHYIESKVKGSMLLSINILWGRYKRHGPPDNYNRFKRQLPLKCIDVQKKGKVLFIYFDKDWCIISKLGMSGWWYSTGDEPEWKKTTKNVVLEFNNRKDLIYSDFLNFGTLTFTQDKTKIQKEIDILAPDIMNDSTTYREMMKRVNNSSIKTKEKLLEDVLIEQKLIVSGIGNYLKSEVLYDARISPLRQVKDVSQREWIQLFHSAKKISKMMYKVLLTQRLDLYFDAMKVYHKDKDSFGNMIVKHKTKAGRMTFWVPSLQS